MNEKQMKDMAVSILLDEYTQLDVAQLLKEYEEAEENGELPDVPDSLDEKCTEMIRREFAQKEHKKHLIHTSKVLSRVAAVALMLIGFCTVSILSVTAWREPVLRFVLETFDRRSSVSMEGEVSQEHNNTPKEIIAKLADIVPADYNIVQNDVRDGYYQTKYVGKDGERIILVISEYQYGNYFDTESAAGTQKQINGYDVVFVYKNGYKVICLDEDQGIMIEIQTMGISEKQCWNIVYNLTK